MVPGQQNLQQLMRLYDKMMNQFSHFLQGTRVRTQEFRNLDFLQFESRGFREKSFLFKFSHGYKFRIVIRL